MFGIFSLVPIWSYIYNDIFVGSDFNITVFGTFGVAFVSFWLLSIMFMYPDLTGRPAWMLRYKVQPGTNQTVKSKKLKTAIRWVLFNDIVMGIPYMMLLYPVQKYMGCSSRPEDIPSVLVTIRDIIAIIIMNEIFFYYTHRMFHWGPLYRMFHKWHHEWQSPVGVVASYAHPVEHIISNLSPLLIPPVLTSSHTLIVWGWIILVQYITVFHHSGYAIPHMPAPHYHDYHHLRFNGNYGSGILDRLHGTDLGTKDNPTKPLAKR